jgi:hypothetical protein
VLVSRVSGSSLTECDDDHATYHLCADLYGGCCRLRRLRHVRCDIAHSLATFRLLASFVLQDALTLCSCFVSMAEIGLRTMDIASWLNGRRFLLCIRREGRPPRLKRCSRECWTRLMNLLVCVIDAEEKNYGSIRGRTKLFAAPNGGACETRETCSIVTAVSE